MLSRAVLLFFSANRPSSELGPCEANFHPRGHTIRAEELTCGRAACNRRATDAVTTASSFDTAGDPIVMQKRRRRSAAQ